MVQMTSEKRSIPYPDSSNMNLGGFSLSFPFLEKLKIYQNFFQHESLWERNKRRLWQHEKLILNWAQSKVHEHLYRVLYTDRLAEIYGLKKTDDAQWKAYKTPEIETKDIDHLLNDMTRSNCNLLEPIMGNLAHKGFADAITWSDWSAGFDASGDPNLRKLANELKRSQQKFAVQSISINYRGVLAGEVACDIDQGRLWKYKLVLFVFYNLLLLGVAALLVTFISQIFAVGVSKWITQGILVVWNDGVGMVVSLAVIVLWVWFVWRKS